MSTPDDLDELALEDEQEELGDDDGTGYRFADSAGEKTTDEEFLTKMWGASAQLEFPIGSPSAQITQQLADVRFPEPVVCTIIFQSAITSGLPLGLPTTSLELIIGLGRTTITQTRSFVAQPTPGLALDLVLELMPAMSILARTSGVGTAAGPGSMILTNTIQVAPVTRINYKADFRRFGMSLPGEADAMEDELERGELEHDRPDVREILTAGEPVPQAPPDGLIQETIAQLTQRFGRQPTRPELVAALARMQARRARRGGGGARPAAARRVPAHGTPERRAFIEQVIRIMEQKLGRRPTKQELRAALASFEVPA